MNTIKIGVVPGAIQEVVVEGKTTVAEVASIAGLVTDGYQVRVNGTVTDVNAEINGNATILLAKQIKGNSTYMVKIGVVPGAIQEVAVEGTTTVAEVASIAGLDTSGYQVRVNGTVTDANAEITSTSTILLAKQIKGNK